MTKEEAVQQVRNKFPSYVWVPPIRKVGVDWLIHTNQGRGGPLALVCPDMVVLYQYWAEAKL